MANNLIRRSLGAAVAAGTILLLYCSVGVQGQQPAAAQNAAETVRQSREELKARQAKVQELRIQLVRLNAELEIQLLESRAAEERVKAAMALLAQQFAPAAAAEGGRAAARVQQLEQQVDALVKDVEALVREVKALRQARGGTAAFSPLDFQALANQKRKDNFHSGKYPGNNLESLSGEQKLLKIPFNIGDGILQLGSTELEDKPAKITGIKVGKKLTNLHFLHACAYFIEEEAPIGSYTVHYADGASETIPIINGKDVTDWWKYPFSKAPTTGKVAWEGDNQAGKDFDATQWLFLSTWKNPRPDVAVTSIDFASTMDTRCAPFCVAITAEEP